ncbi:MAG: hypothetical protein V4754_19455 [Pseudomonadota bacterium]
MRKTLVLLICVLLAGCVNDTASFYIDGRDHALSLRRQQSYFWQSEAEIALVAARLPECQRQHRLDTAPLDDLKVELFDAGEGLWNVRMDKRVWQIETEKCTGLTELEYDPKTDLGRPVGAFVAEDGKLIFEAVAASPADAAPPAR